MPIKKEIVYPFFLECCNLCSDSFWKNIFEDLAYAKCPYGTYINKNFLCCSYKNKEFNYKIERKSPEVLYNQIYNLLTKKVGILSKKERNKKRLHFHLVENKIKKFRQKWSNIRKKNIKDLLIERYIVNIREKYNLSLEQTKYLHSIIIMALIFKVITSKDIEYQNGKIQNIKGISFKQKEIIIERDIYKLDNSYVKEKRIKVKRNLLDNWSKYLINLKKKK